MEDLDQYLYGDEFKAAAPSTNTATTTNSTENQSDEEYEDEEDFEIILDSNKASEINKRSLTSVSIAADKNSNSSNPNDSPANPSANPATVAHFDPFAPANLAGKMIYDHDLDSFEDKPWRKPGADLTDYFNYGFTETTWRAYCVKQRALRDEFGVQKKISVHEQRESRESVRERDGTRDLRDQREYSRDSRDMRDPRDMRERDPRESRDTRDPRDMRERDPRDSRDPSRDSRHSHRHTSPPPPSHSTSGRRVVRHESSTDHSPPSSSMKRRRD